MRQLWKPAPAQAVVAWCAYDLALRTNLAFSVGTLCLVYGLKDNRHTRKTLNDLAAMGKLRKQKTKGTNGVYRMLYSDPMREPRGEVIP